MTPDTPLPDTADLEPVALDVRRPLGAARVALWLVLALLALVVVRLPAVRVPLDQDSGCYVHVGRSWVHGRLPYRDLWDHKPPAIYLVPAALELAGAPLTAVALRACAALFALGTLLALYGIVARLSDQATGIAAAFAYGIFSGAVLVHREALQTEHAMAFFSALSVWLLVVAAQRWRLWPLLLAGLSAGAAVAFKPTAAPVLGLAFLWLLWQQRASGALVFRSLMAVLATGLGFLVVPAAFVIYFSAAGIRQPFLDAMSYNFAYRMADEFAGRGSGWLAVLRSRLGNFAPEQACLALLALAGLVSARLGERGPWLYLLWALGALVGAAGSGRFYAYYFLPVCAALAPLAGHALVSLGRGFRDTAPPRWADARHTLVAVCLAGVVAFGVRHEVRQFRFLVDPAHPNVVLADMAREIRENTQPTDRIFVWGTRQQVYALAQRQAATRYFYDTPFRDRAAARGFFGDDVFESMVDAIRDARCPYIVVTDMSTVDNPDSPDDPNRFVELDKLLKADYTVAREVQTLSMLGATRLYRRRPEAGERRGM